MFNILLLSLLGVITACSVFFVLVILKVRKFFINEFFPFVKSKEYLLNMIDRDSYVNGLSIKELYKKKARFDYIAETYMTMFATILANKMSLALGFRKKNSNDE